ncbi:MAG: hypothetical protein A3B68_08855 [Candidatus Melainabacteria bacterium RIFCSPHIGHO2_02_FULL_34_12]|nr:MAG: hypothetical protein A3B68_08855 [Candidatus Melainabacteria bacterium RIFCSPHIGHO2_02_FULL_34_12]
MRFVKWNILKSERLKKVRGVSFEEIIRAKLVAVKKHPNKEYQDIMLFEYKNYIWIVPFVQTKDELFLKTLYPSRKYTKIYRKEKDNEGN